MSLKRSQARNCFAFAEQETEGGLLKKVAPLSNIFHVVHTFRCSRQYTMSSPS